MKFGTYALNRLTGSRQGFSLLIFLVMGTIGAQTNGESLPDVLDSQTSFVEIKSRADAYFRQKHPGKSTAELTSGHHRDGEYVKYQRWLNFWERHLDPKGQRADLPAYVRRAEVVKDGTGPFAGVPWSNIGHVGYVTGQIGLGRTTSIGFHPTDVNTFYVGTANGGIWKTEDGGQNYIPLGDELPFLSVSSVVVDQNNPQRLFIAVSDHVWYGPPGIGVFSSTDGGQSWNTTALSFSFSQNIRIYRIVADPANPDHMLVATAAGLYETTDGFQSVIQRNSLNCVDVRFAPGSSTVAYLGTADGAFHRSTNGGASWSFVQDFGNNQVRLSVTSLDPSRVYVSHASTLYQSLDQGQIFALSQALPETNSAQHTVISPRDVNVVISGYFELFRSDNSGLTYTKIMDWLGRNGLYHMHVDMRNVHVNPLENDKVYWCNDGGVYRQDVDDDTFENLSDGLVITQYYDIAVSQTSVNVVSGGSQDNGSLFRSEAGQWDDFAATGDGMVTEIDPTDANTLYWEYQNGGMRRYQNGTNTNISPPGKNGNGGWETPYKLDPSNPDRIVAGYDAVYESLDQGNNWTTISPVLSGGNNLDQIAIAPSHPDRIYATRSTTLYAKDAASANWTTHSTPAGSLITDLEVDPLDENIIYISVSGYTSGGKVFRSDDGGASWTNISGSLPNVPIGALELYHDVAGAVFVGTYLGVYYRDATTADWEEYGELPHTDVRDIEIQYAAKKIRIGTHGRGIFEADIVELQCTVGAPDSDNDGVCDDFDVCPDFNDALVGTACDDGNPSTVGETYQADCQCGGGVNNLTYCAAEGAAGTGADWIDRVALNTIDNASGKSAYSDFNAISTTLERGQTYTATVELNAAFSLDEIYGWIDYNRDAAFDNATELLPFGSITNGAATATFTVPATAVTDLTTMRVRVIYADPNNPEPCGSIFGEVEDYGIWIEDSCRPGVACDDGDACTTGETYDANCNCGAGNLTDSDGDGVCDADDVCPGFDDNLIGTTCDDGDPCTTGETYGSDCNCGGGALADSDGDGVCDVDDACPGFDDTLIGTNCDDGDPCTTGETYGNDCNCGGGMPVDSDNDGVCDADDQCPGFDDSLIGMPCDDGDVCTINDAWGNNCQCTGTFIDADQDGSCAANDPDDNDPCVPDADASACAPPCTVFNAENFETGWGIWNDGGGDCGRVASNANSGAYAIRLRDNSGRSSSLYTNALDFAAATSVTLTGSAVSSGFENGEDLIFEASTNGGNSFSTIKSWVAGVDFQNGQRFSIEIAISTSNLSAQTVLRLRADASDNGDAIYLDDLEVNSCSEPVSCTEGAPCDDGDACTENDVYDATCNCAGTFADGDGDGVCNAEDVCPGFDDTQDADNDGIPDGCDTPGCSNPGTTAFSPDPLTHSGGAASTATATLAGGGHADVNFTVSGLNARTGGKPANRYEEVVTVTYVDGGGINRTYGTFSGAQQSSVAVTLPGTVNSVTLSLRNGMGTSVNLSVDPGTVSSCLPPSAPSDGPTSSLFFTAADFRLFPNPTSGDVTLLLAEGNPDARVVVRNLLGADIAEYPTYGLSRLTLRTQDWSAVGNQVYLVTVYCKDRPPLTRRLVVR